MITRQTILFVLIIFITNIIQTITGFAGTVLAMPPSLLLVGADVAKPILNGVAIFVSLIIVIFNFKKILWIEVLKMLLFIGTGFAGGFFIPEVVKNAKYILIIYGVIVCLIAIFFFFFKPEKLKIPNWVLYFFLVLGGLLHNLFISGGPLVVIYARLKIEDKDNFRGTLSFIWLVLNSILLGTHIYNGLWTANSAIILAIGVAVTVGAIFLGRLIVKKINVDIFMKITCILLFISGVSMFF